MQSSIKGVYEIEIPNEKATTYRVVTFIIALINVAAFVFMYFQSGPGYLSTLAALGSFVSLAALLGYLLKLYKKVPGFRIEIAFIVQALLWLFAQNFWLGAGMLCFAALGFYSNKKTMLRFANAGIDYPSFPPKQFPWHTVDFVLLKDGILTLEMKDNRVFQFTLSPEMSAAIEEAAFNEYCQRQVAGQTS